MRKVVQWAIRLVIWLAYQSYRAEGLNALFLILPAKYLAPTLTKHGARIGKNVEMHTPITVHNASDDKYNHYANLQIGSDCYLGRGVFLDLADGITLEDNVTVSMRAILLTHTHAGNSPLSRSKLYPTYAPIRLRTGCYIGAGAIILPGITIGEQAIVGAGAVVSHDVPDGGTVTGMPARLIIGSNNE